MKIKTFIYALGILLALLVVLIFVSIVMNLIIEHLHVLSRVIAAIIVLVIFIVIYSGVDTYLEEKKGKQTLKKGEMYCTVEGCGRVDETHTAHCLEHGRSTHRIKGEGEENEN